MSLLEVRDLDVRHGLLQAVRGVSLLVESGETVALVGANGAGKSTLLRTIAGAHRPARGSVLFDSADITRLPAHKRVGLGLGLVPEGRHLFLSLTVEENLRVAERPGYWNIERVLEAFPLLRERRGSRAVNLSGGERQATAIGRTLTTNPKLLLLDEVSLGLAPVAVDDLYRSLRTVIEQGTTVLLVEQDLGRAMAVAQRVICMLEGCLVLEGRADELTREQVTGAYFGLVRIDAEAGSASASATPAGGAA
jgi:branched-chain amino acid transport system ATP-binding protein